MADATYQPKIYRQQGGNTLVVANGGTLSIEAGGTLTYNGTSVTGGSVIANDITGGDSSLDIVGKVGSSSAGGALNLTGGAANGNTNAGGALAITGGLGLTSGAGGAITVKGGTGGSTGTGGAMTVAGGDSAGASGTAGSVIVRAGAVAGGTGGSVKVTKGDGSTILFQANETGIGFFAATPVVKPATTGSVTGFVAGSGTASKSDSVWAGAAGATAYTVGDIVTALKALGLLTA